MARVRLRPSAYLTPPGARRLERTAGRYWRRVDDARGGGAPPGPDWAAAAWAWSRRISGSRGAGAGVGFGPGRRVRRRCGKRCWSPGRAGEASSAVAAAGRGSQAAGSTGRATAGGRPRERASPALRCGASREHPPRCSRVPAARGARQPAPELNVTAEKRPGASRGVPLTPGTGALATPNPISWTWSVLCSRIGFNSREQEDGVACVVPCSTELDACTHSRKVTSSWSPGRSAHNHHRPCLGIPGLPRGLGLLCFLICA